MESGLNYTIVQPTQLMDNVPIKSLVSQPSPVFHARFSKPQVVSGRPAFTSANTSAINSRSGGRFPRL